MGSRACLSLLGPVGPSNSALLLGGTQGSSSAGEVLSPVGFSPRGLCGEEQPVPPSSCSLGRNSAIGWTISFYFFLIFCNAPPCYKWQSSRCPASWTPQPSHTAPGPTFTHVRPCKRGGAEQSWVHPSLLPAAAPGSPAASKHMPLSLPLEHPLAGQGAFQHPMLLRSLDF